MKQVAMLAATLVVAVLVGLVPVMFDCAQASISAIPQQAPISLGMPGGNATAAAGGNMTKNATK